MIGYNLKILINPKLTSASINVKPKITPSIRGIVFFYTVIKARMRSTILFGPGEQLVTNINKLIDINSGCIIKLQAIRFLLLGMDVLKLPSIFIYSLISKPVKQFSAIFFSGKLQTPITCFPLSFSSL